MGIILPEPLLVALAVLRIEQMADNQGHRFSLRHREFLAQGNGGIVPAISHQMPYTTSFMLRRGGKPARPLSGDKSATGGRVNAAEDQAA